MSAIKIFFCILFLSSFFISANAKILLITGNDFPPFSDEKLKNGGIYTALVTEIMKNLKLEYSLEYLPWARGYSMVAKGAADATFPYAKTKERMNDVLYSSVALLNYNSYIYTTKSNKSKKGPEDFKGGIYCAGVGYFIEESILKFIKNNEIKLHTEHEFKKCIENLINGNATFVVAPENVMNSYKKVKPEYFLNVIRLSKPLSKNLLYVIFSKRTDKNFIKIFDKESKKFMNSEKYKQILSQF